MTAQEVADFLRVHVDTVYAMARRGDLPVRQRGLRSLRFPRAAVEAFAHPGTGAESVTASGPTHDEVRAIASAVAREELATQLRRLLGELEQPVAPPTTQRKAS